MGERKKRQLSDIPFITEALIIPTPHRSLEVYIEQDVHKAALPADYRVRISYIEHVVIQRGSVLNPLRNSFNPRDSLSNAKLS